MIAAATTQQSSSRVVRVTAALFLAAVVVHVVVWMQYRADPYASAYIADARSYHLWAERILADGPGAEPVFHQSPLFPFMAAAVYAVVPEQSRGFAVTGLQVLLSSAAIALLVPLGRRLFGRTACGVAAAALALLYGPFVFYSLKLLPTTLALATQLVGLLALVRARGSPAAWAAAAAGGAWGLAVLARAEMLLFAPLALWFLVERRGEIRRLPLVLAYASALALVVAPATVHNFSRGDFVLVASSAGENLYIGNQPGAGGGYTPLHPAAGDIFSQRHAATEIAEAEHGRELRPSEVSAYWRGRAIDAVTDAPGAWLRLVGRKLGRLAHPGDPTDIYSFALERRQYLTAMHALVATPWTLLLLGGVGLWLALRAGMRHATPLAALAALQAGILLLFFVDARLRLPVYFLLCPFGGLALVSAMRAFKRGHRAFPMLLATLCLVAITSGWFATKPTPRDAVRLASTLSLDGRLAESLAVLEDELARPEPDPAVLDQAGWVLHKRGDYAAARERYAQALGAGLAPAQARQTRTRLGMVLERLGQLEAAAAEHDEAVASGHANAGTFFERGLFRLRRGDRAAARADLERAAQLDPTWPAPREALGAIEAGRL